MLVNRRTRRVGQMISLSVGVLAVTLMTTSAFAERGRGRSDRPVLGPPIPERHEARRPQKEQVTLNQARHEGHRDNGRRDKGHQQARPQRDHRVSSHSSRQGSFRSGQHGGQHPRHIERRGPHGVQHFSHGGHHGGLSFGFHCRDSSPTYEQHRRWVDGYYETHTERVCVRRGHYETRTTQTWVPGYWETYTVTVAHKHGPQCGFRFNIRF